MHAVTPSTAAPAPSQFLGLAAWLALTLAAAAVAAIASVDAAPFYLQLDRPGWAPPPALFGPVWALLYLMMGVAAWLIWRDHPDDVGTVGLRVYAIQLALNALWPWLFFEWHQGRLAFGGLVLLWVVVALTWLLFFRMDRIAAFLLLPYLAWTTYAAVLTYSLWQLNPELLG